MKRIFFGFFIVAFMFASGRPVQADEPNPFYAYQQRYSAGAAEPFMPADVTPALPLSHPSKPQATEQADAAPAPAFNSYRQQYTDEPTPAANAPGGKRAELNISAIYDNDPSSDINGGSSYGIDTTLYSATIDDRWRLFAGQLFTNEQEPQGEGHINYARSAAGFEYSDASWLTRLSPTFNDYNGNSRVGVAGDATWTINDSWAVGGAAELFARDTPLRALNAGVTANAYSAVADWDQAGKRDLRLNGDFMTFSDDNLRTGLTLSDTEHLYAGKNLTVDGLASAAGSNNSENEDRPYFNPRQDLLASVGAHIGQPLYQGQGLAYDHSVDIKPGAYWQRNYGTSGAVTAGYTQHLNYRNDYDGSLGVVFTRQSADGTPENDLAVLLNLSRKF